MAVKRLQTPYEAIQSVMQFKHVLMHTIHMSNYGVFVKEEMYNVRKSLIYANNALILATVHLLVSERAGLLEQKIEPQMVTDGNSNFAQ